MPFNIGPFELIIVLLIVIAVFGAGRVAGIGKALGQSVREFRQESRVDPDATKDAGNADLAPTRATPPEPADNPA